MGVQQQGLGIFLASILLFGSLGVEASFGAGQEQPKSSPESGASSLQGKDGQSQACGDKAPASSKADASRSSSKEIPCPVAVVKSLGDKNQLPAMRNVLESAHFVGDADSLKGEQGYAIMPLRHGSTLEVYKFDEENETWEMSPLVSRKMADDEIYILRMPESDKAICVTVKGEKRCWRPGDSFNGNFLRWSSNKERKK